MRVLRECLASNSGLILLSMNLCRLCEEGAQFLAGGLAKNRKLLTLMLSGNAMKDPGFYALADAISKGSLPLKHLDISNNIITDDSAIPFAKALHSNVNLE
jgi:Ran GTPase-activating protein (RanGAP) involved in mRNA processing and transport